MDTYYERNKESIKAKRLARYYSNKEEHLAKNKAWRQANPEKFQVYRKRWESKSPSYVMVHNAKRRASEYNIPFDLDWRQIVIPQFCPILGIELNSGTHESAASLDRVIPSLGYINGNCRVISVRANRLKSDASEQELEAILNYLRA